MDSTMQHLPVLPEAQTRKKGLCQRHNPFSGTGAADRNRTGDLLITNQLLYRLSYSSEGRGLYAIRPNTSTGGGFKRAFAPYPQSHEVSRSC